jgi:hypothetical protein
MVSAKGLAQIIGRKQSASCQIVAALNSAFINDRSLPHAPTGRVYRSSVDDCRGDAVAVRGERWNGEVAD